MPGLPRCRRARSDAGESGSVRRETANRRGWPTALSARYSTKDTVSGSAQCRSSMATTSPSGLRRRRNCSTASPLTACESTPPPGRAARPPATAPGSRTARCGSHGASEGSSGSGHLRSSCSRASVTGRYGALAEAGTARPITTGTCRPAAIRDSSRIRRDLPMPASPVMTAQPPRPASAPSSADPSAWISARRPTRTGHSTSPTTPVCRIGAMPVTDQGVVRGGDGPGRPPIRPTLVGPTRSGLALPPGPRQPHHGWPGRAGTRPPRRPAPDRLAEGTPTHGREDVVAPHLIARGTSAVPRAGSAKG